MILINTYMHLQQSPHVFLYSQTLLYTFDHTPNVCLHSGILYHKYLSGFSNSGHSYTHDQNSIRVLQPFCDWYVWPRCTSPSTLFIQYCASSCEDSLNYTSNVLTLKMLLPSMEISTISMCVCYIAQECQHTLIWTISVRNEGVCVDSHKKCVVFIRADQVL